MEQRPLRLGDIVDDYCPRERRITNHAIVAVVDNVIRQTRCSTCDAEHEYKEAKIPKKKLKATSADHPGGVLVTPKPPAAPNGEADDVVVELDMSSGENGHARADDGADHSAGEHVAAENGVPESDAPVDEPAQPDGEVSPENWLAHRPLIRATLPRVDGDPPPPRAIPEFTMHQRHGRGFGGRGFRQGSGNPNGPFRGNGNGNGGEADGNRASQPRAGRRRRRRRR